MSPGPDDKGGRGSQEQRDARKAAHEQKKAERKAENEARKAARQDPLPDLPDEPDEEDDPPVATQLPA